MAFRQGLITGMCPERRTLTCSKEPPDLRANPLEIESLLHRHVELHSRRRCIQKRTAAVRGETPAEGENAPAPAAKEPSEPGVRVCRSPTWTG